MAFKETKDPLTGKGKQHVANSKCPCVIQSHSIIQPLLNLVGMGNNDKKYDIEGENESKGKYILKSTNRFYFFAVKTAIEYLNHETGKKWEVEQETKDKKGVYLKSSEYDSKEKAEADAKKVKKNIPAVKEKLFKGFGVEVKEV